MHTNRNDIIIHRLISVGKKIFMAGNTNSGRPGGNPDFLPGGKLRKFQFKQKLDRPLEKTLSVRVPLDLYDQVKSGGKDWADDVRSILEQIYLEGKEIQD
jgi:hypothetical protein